jgi:hypothetical protein
VIFIKDARRYSNYGARLANQARLPEPLDREANGGCAELPAH